MAEFCKVCAKKYGMPQEPLYFGEFCEGCGVEGLSYSIIDRITQFFNSIFKSKKINNE